MSGRSVTSLICLLALCANAPAAGESFLHKTTTEGLVEQDVTLKTVGGPEITAQQLKVDAEGSVSGAGVPAGVTVENLRSIQFNHEGSSSRGPYQLRLRGGSILYVSNVTIAEEQCRFLYAGEDYSLPIDALRAVQFDTSREAEVFEKGAAEPLAEMDRLYLKIDDQLQSVTGIVESVSSGNVTFLFDDQSRQLRMDQVYGFVIADFEAEPIKPGNAEVLLTDGSRLLGGLQQLMEKQLEIGMGAAEIAIPLERVQRIDLKSDRLEFLSDIDPVTSSMNPIVTLEREWQRDRSVGGNPLTLRQGNSEVKLSFEKGIGTHAESTLEFENARDFNRFVAVIGIDTETGGKGDCLFKVVGDGETLFEQRVQATDEPRPVNVDIGGKKRIALVVLAGEQLDLADHANWCEARFLKTDE